MIDTILGTVVQKAAGLSVLACFLGMWWGSRMERKKWIERAKTSENEGQLFWSKEKHYRITETDVLKVKCYGHIRIDSDLYLIIKEPKFPFIVNRIIKPYKDQEALYTINGCHYLPNNRVLAKVEYTESE